MYIYKFLCRCTCDGVNAHLSASVRLTVFLSFTQLIRSEFVGIKIKNKKQINGGNYSIFCE